MRDLAGRKVKQTKIPGGPVVDEKSTALSLHSVVGETGIRL